MDPCIQWNIAICSLIPAGAPFMPMAGMSSFCPLKTVTLFVLQLTRRANYNPAAPSFYLPLQYDTSQNQISVYIPPRMEVTAANSLPYLIGIDGHLKQFCEQFRSSGNPGCVIYPAIRQLLSTKNLLGLYPLN